MTLVMRIQKLVIVIPFASSQWEEVTKYGPLTNLCLFLGSLLARLVATGTVVGVVLRLGVVARVVPDAFE